MGNLKLIDHILNLLFPPRCVFCRNFLVKDENGWCNECQETLPWLIGKEAMQKIDFVSQCVSVLWYQENVKESIHRYKFEGASGYSGKYGTLVAQCITDHLAEQYDLITWVPLSAYSLKKRGYDQAKLLAEAVARELGGVAIKTLKKKKRTNMQSTIKEDSARRANVLGAYDAVNPKQIEGKRVLLVDDVVTTGATLSECARVLRMFGASDVVCATLVRARRDSTSRKNQEESNG